MTFLEYMEGAARTMPPDLGTRDLLADAALGLCGEAGEIEGAEPGEPRDDEIGDGWWYVAVAYRTLEVEPECVRREDDGLGVDALFRAASRVAEHAKKVRYHQDPLARHRDAIVEGLRTYATALSHLTERPDADIWAENIAKLEARYPDGFEPKSD